MKRSPFPVAVLFFVFCTLTFFLWQNRSQLLQNPLKVTRPLNYPTYAVPDNKGNLYIADTQYKRIVKSDTSGRVIFSMKGGSRSEGAFYEAMFLRCDDGGNLYILNTDLSIDTGYITSERIQKYSPEGRFIATLLDVDYKDVKGTDNSRVKGFRITGATLEYFIKVSDSECALVTISAEDGREISRKVISIAADDYNNVAFTASGVLLTGKDGGIYQPVDEGVGRLDLPEIINPWDITYIRDTLFVTDLVSLCVWKVLPGSRPESVIGKRGGGGDGLSLYEYICAGNDGNLYTVNSVNGKVTCVAQDGNVLFSFFEISAPASAVAFSVILWLALAADAALFIVIGVMLARMIYRAKKSLALKIILIVQPILVASMISISSIIFHSAESSGARSARMSAVLEAELAAAAINGDTLRIITAPSQRTSEEYQKMTGTITSILNENSDEWNENKYIYVYKMMNSMPFVVADITGYYGTMYPYPHASQKMIETIQSGKSAFDEYTDSSGTWSSGFAAIRDSSGAVAGVLEMTENAYTKGEQRSRYYLHLLVGVLAAAAVSIVLILIFTRRFISNPVMHLVETFKGLSEGEGDLTYRIPVTSHDELATLASHFNTFAEKIRLVVRDARTIADALAASSAEISAGSQRLAGNTQDQASSVEEASACVEQIHAESDLIAGHTERQVETLSQMKKQMEELTSSISRMREQMDNSRAMTAEIDRSGKNGMQSLTEMNSSMQKIRTSSHEMESIIKIIQDISEQINLLALNAAIESARAGDAGRGFAVVADEVSKLAEQTAGSVSEIDQLIRKNTNEIVRGNESLNKATSLIASIISGVQEINTIIIGLTSQMEEQVKLNRSANLRGEETRLIASEINERVEQQKKAMEEIHSIVSGINDLTQSSAAAAEEMASSTEEVSGMAEALNEKVRYFKV